MNQPVPVPPIASWTFSPPISYVAMYAPHTRTTDGFAVIATFCCGVGASARATTHHASTTKHANRVTRPIESIVSSAGGVSVRAARQEPQGQRAVSQSSRPEGHHRPFHPPSPSDVQRCRRREEARYQRRIRRADGDR